MNFLKKNKLRKFIFWVGLGGISFSIVFQNKILTLNRPVDSKILVVEGWLGIYELELLKKTIPLDKYETIYVTGIAHEHPYYLLESPESQIKELPAVLFNNGCLGIRESALKELKDSISEIQVFAHSLEVLNEYAHFYVTVDDQTIGSTFVNETPKNYTFKCPKPLCPKTGIYIYYNNNRYYKKMNRNLIVDSVLVNKTVFSRASDFYRTQDIQTNKDRYTNFPFRSDAEFTANYLKTIGIKNKIIVIDTFFSKRNKTLAAAKKIVSTLKHSNITSFNVVSVNGHSRRSYLSYLTATSTSVKPQIGIISIENNGFKKSLSIPERAMIFFDEYFSLFVAWIIKIAS